MLKNFDYSEALNPDEAVVELFDEVNIYPSLKGDIKRKSEIYGFTLSDQKLKNTFKNVKVRHAIIIDGMDNPIEITKKYDNLLSQYHSATIALSYSSERAYKESSLAVEKLKKYYGNRINYLRPTRINDTQMYRPSLLKLIDNSICDSVRIKYKPLKVGELPVDRMPEDVVFFFNEMSKLYSKYKLYHRSSTDGFISLRRNNNEYYITSTKCDKVSFDPNRIVLVHEFNRENNVLKYSGAYLPSSDSVEAAIVYLHDKSITSLIHTHASDQYTRNSKYSHLIKIPQGTYGEADLGDKVYAAIDMSSRFGMVIMEDHGEVFYSRENSFRTLDRFSSYVEKS